MFTSRAKIFFRRALRYTPNEGARLKETYWRLQRLKRRIQVKIAQYGEKELPDPHKVYWIAPSRIVFHTDFRRSGDLRPIEHRVFHPRKDVGAVYDGDWDLSKHRFEDLSVARAINARVNDGADWSETEFYQELMVQIKAGEVAPWDLRNQSDLDARCAYLDRLIASIRTGGFKQNFEVHIDGGNSGLDRDPRFSAEIMVNIGRDGRYLFQDGRHRLSVAIAVGVPLVPVKVFVRHEKWVEFRRGLRDIVASGEHTWEVVGPYQNALHPDLEDLPHEEGCEVRYEAMAQHLPASRGSLLDVGCNLGYFCHRFEDLGFECIGVEDSISTARAAEVIRISEGRRFQIIVDNIFGASQREPVKGKHFSIVLVINSLHHFLHGDSNLEKLIAWLQNLDVEVMFFEQQRPKEALVQNSFDHFSEEAFLELVLQHSMLTHRQLLHIYADGRGLHRLFRA